MSKKKRNAYFICIAALAVLIVGLIAFWNSGRKDSASAQEETVIPSAEPDRRVVVKEVDKVVEVEKEFTSSTLQDGLREMGTLITQEYYFTQVMNYSSIKQFLSIDLPLTESSYIASYDGVVEAGLDFRSIKVEKDEEDSVITVTLPAASIQSVSVDPDSFTLYYEKTGVGNHVSISDYNTSLSELETNAREKAVEKGVLTAADASAQSIISNFIHGLAGQEYTIVFKTLE